MVERKNRDLKTQMAILVGTNHTDWPNKLPADIPPPSLTSVENSAPPLKFAMIFDR
jgi:hypothetical protein